MSLVAAYLLLSPLSRTADPTVSLTKTGDVGSILRELSKKTDSDLTATDSRAKEILIVSFKGVPLSQAMQQIGWATYGAWQKTSTGYKLVRDHDAEVAAERSYTKWQTREATQAIAKFRKRILEQKLGPEMTAWERQMSDRSSRQDPTAIETVLAEALGAIQPENTIFLKPESTCVYSDTPTPSQYRFTKNLAPVLQAFNEVSGRLAKHIVVRCSYKFEQGYASVKLYDERGEFIDSANVHFSLYDASQTRPKELADQIPTQMQVHLSEGSKFYIRPLQKWSVWPTDTVLAAVPDIVDRVRNPEKYEPLSYFAADVWQSVADWQNRSLVANIDDVYMTPSWAQNTPNLQDAFRQAGGYNAELKSGWLVARPSLPTPPWQHRLDRAALGKLARRQIDGSIEMFQAIGNFSASLDTPPDPYQTSQYLAWAGAYFLIDLRLWDSARVFGNLGPQLQTRLLAGGPVDLSEISPKGKQAIYAAVAAADLGEHDLQHEPTVRFPLGVPQAGILRATIYDNTQVYFSLPDTSGNPRYYGGFDMGGAGEFVRKIKASNPEQLKDLQVTVVAISGVSLGAVLAPDSQAMGMVNIYSMAPPTYHEAVSWNNAPKWLREKIMSAPVGN